MSSHQYLDGSFKDEGGNSSGLPLIIQESNPRDMNHKEEATRKEKSIEHSTQTKRGGERNRIIPLTIGYSFPPQSSDRSPPHEHKLSVDDPNSSRPAKKTALPLSNSRDKSSGAALILPFKKRFSDKKVQRGDEESGEEAVNLPAIDQSNETHSAKRRRTKRSVRELAPGIFKPSSWKEYVNSSPEQEVESAIRFLREKR